jgi:hypothetical protein
MPTPFVVFVRSLLGVLLALLPLAASAQTVVPRYAKFEASWTLAGQTGNPFDPADNDVDVTFTGPRGAKTTQPAFWDGDRWRVRYAPPAVGLYTLRVMRNGHVAAPADLRPKSLRCIASSNPGFVRRDPRSARRFVFDSGKTYYPLGMDAAWLPSGQTSYDPTFTQMQAAGMNWARVWMNAWDGKNLEWAVNKADNPKPGTLLLDVARRWDAIFASAEKHGIYIQMTLQHHGQYTAHTDPNWADNPFNVQTNRAGGGFLQNPDDFFTNAEAQRLTRLKYRYITARYGYSTHLLSYELFNEVQNITETQSHFSDVVSWHKEMAAAIRSEDVNHHLITTSNSVPGEPLARIGLDYDQIHTYVSDIISFFTNVSVPADVPVFIGEWGPSDTKTGMTEGFLHDGLWASIMAPTAGAGQFWYWDAVEKNNWWPQFTSVSGFLRAGGARPAWNTITPGVQSHGAFGDLSFALPGGWGPFTRDTVSVPSGGAAPNLSGLSSYLQGSFHKDLRPHPITFLVNCPSPCQFLVHVGTVAKAGAHPVLSVNGKAAAEADFPAANADHAGGQTLTANLPAGPSRVTLDNTGPDWFIPGFTVTRYAPPVGILAKGSAHAAEFWAYNRDRTGASPAGATLTLPGFAPGVYTVRFWDTWAGHALPPVSATVKNGTLTVLLPPVTRDIAGVVTLH